MEKTVNYYVSGGNGIQIYVEEKGNPEKTTILFTSSGYMSSRQSWHPLWYDTELGEKFHLINQIITVGWSMGTPTTMTFMKINPDIKIDGFISVGGMIYLNFTEASLNTSEEFVKYSIAAIDPDYKFSTIAYGLNGISNFRTFKPASDQFRAFKLGESIIVPPEYRKFEAKHLILGISGISLVL
ncbi:hypothetical protein GLOIN_2v1845714 [Rhizophagus irregularis DAOM 181602=DAOM 197198]|uniref:Alpha/beta-hydrolase n=1 Tax=Rhizophagus irregularis (strain DAOM 181602 / DAOM 197198 / MUCL 43194) TaxID=747089 RepID=A0A2P4PEH1_RHIID|nr:hypothetical protein GLOIN_2v1845714 [Rhizophagus irregularis DAOM 181602=DAOM 197198]POG63779.1 hypothetical protein GLOIN_2v1845714 [Rhizophagus irregularis DAOM 181602=DAOM 197198]|eukprot:XP_025170645.1 hypothetical protein GLOIN_2v1845714 [Rhizophagus irregularis DAOM 181602=DAOM 197198]